MESALAVCAISGPWALYKGEEKQQVEAILAGRDANLIADDALKYMISDHNGELQVQWQIARQKYESGKVRPVITGTVPFDARQLQAALDESAKGMVGKLVVKVQ